MDVFRVKQLTSIDQSTRRTDRRPSVMHQW